MIVKGKDHRLPKRFKEKWVKALRSGNYKQTKCTLHDSDGYCCLGVACSIAGVTDSCMGRHGQPLMTFVPEKFPKLLTTLEGKETNPIIIKLINLNDRKGWSFKKIAAYIQRYL